MKTLQYIENKMEFMYDEKMVLTSILATYDFSLDSKIFFLSSLDALFRLSVFAQFLLQLISNFLPCRCDRMGDISSIIL